VTADVTSDPNLFSRPQTVAAEGRSVTFRPDREATLTVPLHRKTDGTCRVVFTVSPTAVPGAADTRMLGVHFLQFRYAAP
jgi:hypothetical protein